MLIMKIFKKVDLYFLIGITLLFTVFLYTQITTLSTGSYIRNEKDLYRIDSVKMLRGVYTIGGPKSGRSWQFEDETYKEFYFSGPAESAVTYTKELFDTLKYSSLFMTVYTDKSGFENYYNKSNDEKIDVLGIQLGDKKYFTLTGLNNAEKSRITSLLIFCSIIYTILSVIQIVRLIKF